ncbi:uncharacterized protein BKCO1_1100062 [Diplodia corticola]|uniref:Uncharacterized protein n=1 Tax=Diplodia corticola TaxID=236234 RepID=A0A1J9S951_9PEZI|nr:uncharacterized protein BKCO1_1100062 [Diplodia corticola]OJD36428.1 hypothetical protein BKCO1_1100062 [Diplodia corticola]
MPNVFIAYPPPTYTLTSNSTNMDPQCARSMLECEMHSKVSNCFATPLRLRGHAADPGAIPRTEAGSRWNSRAILLVEGHKSATTRYYSCLQAINAVRLDDRAIHRAHEKRHFVVRECMKHERFPQGMQRLEQFANKHGTIFIYAGTAPRDIVELAHINKTVDPTYLVSRQPQSQHTWSAALFGCLGYNSSRMYLSLTSDSFDGPDGTFRDLEKTLLTTLPPPEIQPKYCP